MANDEYELMPHDEILKLKDELNRLKTGSPSSSLQDSIESLRKSIDSLLELFRIAAKEIEEEGGSSLIKKIDELNERIDEISDQNEKIASGILAVADMIGGKAEMPKSAGEMPPFMQEEELPQLPPLGESQFPQPRLNIPRGMPPPPPMEMRRMPPPMGMPPPPTGGQLPPLPPRPARRGLFGR